MTTDWITIQLLAVLFLATFVRSAFGFGEALIAVPLLSFVMPVETAVPVAVLVSITVAGIILLQDWRPDARRFGHRCGSHVRSCHRTEA